MWKIEFFAAPIKSECGNRSIARDCCGVGDNGTRLWIDAAAVLRAGSPAFPVNSVENSRQRFTGICRVSPSEYAVIDRIKCPKYPKFAFLPC
jgi:hypothetical protein